MAAHQALPSLGFSRQEHWSGLPFSSPVHESEKWKKSLSRVWLFAIPWNAAHQAPPSMGFSRQEYWSGVPLPSPFLSLLLIKKLFYLPKFPFLKPNQKKKKRKGEGIKNSSSMEHGVTVLNIKWIVFFFLIFYFHFILLYNIVLVLQYIDMNPPPVCMSSQSWTPLPPPTP